MEEFPEVSIVKIGKHLVESPSQMAFKLFNSSMILSKYIIKSVSSAGRMGMGKIPMEFHPNQCFY